MIISRDTFDKLKHYVSVRLQQGVPLVDADWNEKDDIRKYEMNAFLKWFVGDGVPLGNDGFKIVAIDPPARDFTIRGGDGTTDGAGRCLVDGWDAINEDDVRYSQQILTNQERADALGVDRVEPLSDAMDGVHTVYLDMWEREVTPGEEGDDQFIYDWNLINQNIGEPTCTRIKREWVVRVVAGEEAPEPEVDSGHVHYPLAHITLRAVQPISQEDITDLRRTEINFAALVEEITDARGIKGNLGNRLDESLTKGGQLRQNVVGNAQVRAGAGIEEDKITFSDAGHNHDGVNGQKISPINLLGVNASVSAANLNILTGGLAGGATNLHYHQDIPAQTLRFSAHFPVKKFRTYREFDDHEFAYLKCPGGTKCGGIIPLNMPNGSRIKKIGVYTRSEGACHLWVSLVHSPSSSNAVYEGFPIKIESPGYAERTEDVFVDANNSYHIAIYKPILSLYDVYIDGVIVDYQITTLF